MTRVEGTVFRSYRCRTCGTENKGDPAPTLAKGVVLGYCTGCRARRPSDDLGPVEVVSPTRLPDPPEPVVPSVVETHDLASLAREVVAEEDDGTLVETASGLCGVCQEYGRHDPDCPEVDRVQRAYVAWRATSDGEAVYVAIRRRAIELRRRGWRRYGIQAIAEVVRFDHALSVGPDAAGYRVNNSHLSRLARDLMAHEPDLDGFFETRELRS